MINKIRIKLVIGYTLAIVAILVATSVVGYITLEKLAVKANEKTLMAYLLTELHEAKEKFSMWQENPEIVKPNIMNFKYHKMTFNNVSYWIAPDKTILSAEEIDHEISKYIREYVENWNYPSKKIETIYIKSPKSKMVWHFIMTGQELYDGDTYLGKVVVGTNLTPLDKISKRYTRVAIIIILIVSLSAFFIGNYFASKAVLPVEKTMQIQKEFIGDASHEMRTPLSVMLASVDMIEGKASDKKIISNMKTEIMNMRELVNSLLVLARIEDTESKTGFSSFNLSNLIKNVVKNLQIVANKKNIKIKVNVGHIHIFANESSIKNLITILLDNAIKYSNENTEINIKASRHLGYIKIAFKDQGIGIPPEDLDKIFARFYRVDKARSQKTAGYGLGLAMAKKILELHKGKIEVESSYKKGSTFTVTLPINLKG